MKKANKNENQKAYDLNIFMSSKVRIDNAIGMFTADSKGQPLEIKKSGNGAVIPFLKRYTGKHVIVFVIDEEAKQK